MPTRVSLTFRYGDEDGERTEDKGGGFLLEEVAQLIEALQFLVKVAEVES